tara:strand:- start:18872 stop:19402 length:531 start_codon:yes stop_codon:yes gene_type:complete
MLKPIKWVTLFSQTGSEIVNLSNSLGRWPDYIITNNTDTSVVDPQIKDRITHMLNKAEAKTLDVLSTIIDSNECLITLHGWLRIVPTNICDSYNIYNGHPGLITRYEELKGKDPQNKILKNLHQYDYYGSVVHKVTPEVDGGEIVSCCEYKNNLSFENFSKKVKNASYDAWVEFLK